MGTRRRSACAVAAAGVLAACGSGATVGGHGTDGSSSGATTVAQSGPCSDQPDMRQQALAVRMTLALQKHSRSTLLALTSSPAARSRIGTWYDNVAAIGFTTAAVGAEGTDPGFENGAAPKTQAVTVGIGLHNKLDETLDTDLGPDAPATQYRLGTTVVHDRGGKCHLTISSWQSVNNAPWDSPRHLTVVHTAHTVVAGEPSVAGDVHSVASVAETAAAFDLAFYRSVGAGDDVRLHGFVVFVPASIGQTNSWFTYKRTRKPGGWTADVGRNAAGVEYPLNGVQEPLLSVAGLPKPAKVSVLGGGRVVITRTGLRASRSERTATLVHEFTHDIYNNYNDGWFSGKSVDPALAEGAARYIEAFYRLNPNPRAKNTHSMNYLGPALRPRFGSLFNDQVPTEGQIYGNGSTADFYYDLSATCFSYLAGQYGLKFALQSIRNAYANDGGPFSGIVTDNKGGTLTFGNPDVFERRWAKWIRRQVG